MGSRITTAIPRTIHFLICHESDQRMRSLLYLLLMRTVLLVVGCTAGLTAQQTIVVDRFMRPGAQFSDLPAAYAAAPSGAVLLLRATTANPIDSYATVPIIGKGVTIVGEYGVGLPPVAVTGPWSITGVQAGEALTLRNLSLYGYSLPFSITAWACTGALVMDRIIVRPIGHDVFFFFSSEMAFSDVGLIVFSQCNIDISDTPWKFIRSRVLANDSTFFQSRVFAAQVGWAARPTLRVENSEFHMANCRVYGGDFTQMNTGSKSQAIWLTGAARLYASAGSILRGGISASGLRLHWTEESFSTFGQAQLRYDSSTQLIGDLGQLGLVEIQEPVTGLSIQESPGSIRVDQFDHGTPLAPSILLMAALQPTPWQNIIGPCYLDPTNLWGDLAVTPASGPLSRTFTIPPSIPLGQWVGVQAFTLGANNQVQASNVTVVGVW